MALKDNIMRLVLLLVVAIGVNCRSTVKTAPSDSESNSEDGKNGDGKKDPKDDDYKSGELPEEVTGASLVSMDAVELWCNKLRYQLGEKIDCKMVARNNGQLVAVSGFTEEQVQADWLAAGYAAAAMAPMSAPRYAANAGGPSATSSPQPQASSTPAPGGNNGGNNNNPTEPTEPNNPQNPTEPVDNGNPTIPGSTTTPEAVCVASQLPEALAGTYTAEQAGVVTISITLKHCQAGAIVSERTVSISAPVVN